MEFFTPTFHALQDVEHNDTGSQKFFCRDDKWFSSMNNRTTDGRTDITGRRVAMRTNTRAPYSAKNKQLNVG